MFTCGDGVDSRNISALQNRVFNSSDGLHHSQVFSSSRQHLNTAGQVASRGDLQLGLHVWIALGCMVEHGTPLNYHMSFSYYLYL